MPGGLSWQARGLITIPPPCGDACRCDAQHIPQPSSTSAGRPKGDGAHAIEHAERGQHAHQGVVAMVRDLVGWMGAMTQHMAVTL